MLASVVIVLHIGIKIFVDFVRHTLLRIFIIMDIDKGNHQPPLTWQLFNSPIKSFQIIYISKSNQLIVCISRNLVGL